MEDDPCRQPKQLSHKDMTECVFHKGHDYFQGSELAYLLGLVLLGCFPLVVIFLAYIAIKVSIHLISQPLSDSPIIDRCQVHEEDACVLRERSQGWENPWIKCT